MTYTHGVFVFTLSQQSTTLFHRQLRVEGGGLASRVLSSAVAALSFLLMPGHAWQVGVAGWAGQSALAADGKEGGGAQGDVLTGVPPHDLALFGGALGGDEGASLASQA